MSKQELNKNREQVLTDRMNVGTREFNEFQAILLNKSKEGSKERKKMIEKSIYPKRIKDHH